MANKFLLKPLGYSHDFLEPYIDEETVKFHHDKHQQTYTDNLNKALENYPKFFQCSLVEILKNLDKIPEVSRQAVINNSGGVYNHEFYWESIGPNKGGEPKGLLKESIINTFGSFENFKRDLKAASLGQFGSGWGWLVLDKSKNLKITSTPNQICPISNNEIPLLNIDVWEHAYYLKYQNRRADYIENFFNLINWDKVEERYNSALK